MKRLLRSARFRWWSLAGLWLAVLVIGISGFVEQGSAEGIDRTFLDNLYLTLQMATLNYDGSSGPMNWQVQLARFVVPILAASTVLQSASVVFRRELRRWRAGRAKGHTIVCGLGETGARVASAYLGAGERVVAIEPDAVVASAAGITDALEHLVEASATDPGALAEAGVAGAARIVVVTGSDATNVEVLQALVLATEGRKGALRCLVELTDADLAVLLRASDLDATRALRTSFFSLHERAARALLSEAGPDLTGDRPPHLLVMSLGRFGRSLLLALCQQWADLHPGTKLCPTVVDRAARGKWEALRLQHPALDDVCEPTLVDLDLDEPDPEEVQGFIALLAEDPPVWVAAAFAEEPRALAHAMFLHQRLPDDVPIVVRTRTSGGLGGLLDAQAGSPFPGLVRFPFLDRTCTPATVEGGVREQLAEAVHEDYLAHRGADAPATSLARPWCELTDEQRDDSRERVDGILEQLASVGCELVPLRRWGAPQVELTEGEIDAIAGQEHERWRADRTADGWVHGEVKDEVAKRNPLLVPWSELADSDRQWNLASARNLLPMLARNGFEAVRQRGHDTEGATIS
jgi:hypothetical protein